MDRNDPTSADGDLREEDLTAWALGEFSRKSEDPEPDVCEEIREAGDSLRVALAREDAPVFRMEELEARLSRRTIRVWERPSLWAAAAALVAAVGVVQFLKQTPSFSRGLASVEPMAVVEDELPHIRIIIQSDPTLEVTTPEALVVSPDNPVSPMESEQETETNATVAAVTDAPVREESGEESPETGFSDWLATKNHPVLELTMDTGEESIRQVRNALNRRLWPSSETVRIEELVNSLDYGGSEPMEVMGPIALRVEEAPCPWEPTHRLAMITLEARESMPDATIRLELDSDRVASYRVLGQSQSAFTGEMAVRAPLEAGIQKGRTLTTFLQILPAPVMAEEMVTYASPATGRPMVSNRELTMPTMLTVTIKSEQDALTRGFELVGGIAYEDASAEFRAGAAAAALGLFLEAPVELSRASLIDIRRHAERNSDLERQQAGRELIQLMKKAERL